ncbi:UDP-glucose dehydrogenase family protein [Listeria fleischmannii]|jgi:UDPglucose 6-dehydrogenase|uniref:UDP-glucose 6-dehydrogenase n=1 Tax=Listeria fleischmannii TaxID=1069827 RepID=A0A841YFF8_9LIST|nr:UDP-glucose/GDP-mannose dehydrogenase family protein [Listeria fleischmannii]EIA19817.1 UDP-glucose 6-dehydrogenase [Listeria fleischmannii subsp. coloradonensis]MBC1399172.1 UDP-glucose/GDP-mannose dehydrogenase family protein [Listeria fleischmannii]MBC1427464.1 UDP-glucose/GDP-mannose dehydrogenase family protein [Listeria fleischmannii]STY36204.1 UDP-glucose 6-dehydrogenase ywqF [Listeria fleischmannii subsp. coloradonensis]
MNIAIVGTGYVGLVTGVGLAEIGHNVTCIDVVETKIMKLKLGISPIYEPGIESLILKNMAEGRLDFTTSFAEGAKQADVIYLAVGTPTGSDGEIEMKYFNQAAVEMASVISRPTIVVIKSTVPVGTNEALQHLMDEQAAFEVSVVSNPEFLREGMAIHDLFHGDRIVIGTTDKKAMNIMMDVNQPFRIPIVPTTPKSAELIKYASNAFLATKISFINEIANLCELVGADVQEVSLGMGLDKRIGAKFLQAGIGYGGSCFPKDTLGLLQIAHEYGMTFPLLEEVIQANAEQQRVLVSKLLGRMEIIRGRKIAILGIAFKPNTDDVREAPALKIMEELVSHGAKVYAYDPVVKADSLDLPRDVVVANSIQEALTGADAALIVTEWSEIKAIQAEDFKKWMKQAYVFDGRNCLDPDAMLSLNVYYEAIGRGGEMKELAVK